MSSTVCKKGIPFSECELDILRSAVDKSQENQGKIAVSSPAIAKIIGIVEEFIKKNKLVCYGGTAINNILPPKDQFYDKSSEIPDYDFFSNTALFDAKKLADIYAENGFNRVEAKSGTHHGTYKVFVDFIPVADITQMSTGLFNILSKKAVHVDGILYAPVNYLRMSMYLELSRPNGDTDRWEKILKRLILINKNYPLTTEKCGEVDFQRGMDDGNSAINTEIYENVKDTLKKRGVVFFGGYAMSSYSKYMPAHLKRQLEKIPDFDVLAEDPRATANTVKKRLGDIGVKNVAIVKRPKIGEIVADNYEILVGKDTIAVVYQPIACHSYNVVGNVKIATIDTMLSFYLAFLYADESFYDTRRITCMSKYLFDVQAQNRLSQKGVLKRFSINCVGHQQTVEEMRAERADKYEELKNKRDAREYEEWFLRYTPAATASPRQGPKRANRRTKRRENKRKTKSNKSVFSRFVERLF